jgi:hypothetical protein
MATGGAMMEGMIRRLMRYLFRQKPSPLRILTLAELRELAREVEGERVVQTELAQKRGTCADQW